MKTVPPIPIKPTGEVKTQAMLTYLRKRLIRRECCDRLGLGRDCKVKDIRYCKSHGCETKTTYIYHESITKDIIHSSKTNGYKIIIQKGSVKID